MTDYEYLTELGIEVFPLDNYFKTPEKIKTKCLILEKNPDNSFCKNGETRDLLIKMLAAIGLDINAVICENVITDYKKNIIKYQAKTVLLMGNFKDDNYHYTYHPEQILQNTNLKKEVWEVLKRLKKCL